MAAPQSLTRRAGLAGAIALAAATQTVAQVPTPAPRFLAATSDAAIALAGGWEIRLPRSRKCRVQLNARDIRDGHMLLGVLPVCKATIPEFALVARWALGEDGAVHIIRQGGQPLYVFRRDAAGIFRSDRGDMTLEPLGVAADGTARPEIVDDALDALRGQPPRDAQRGALLGRYGVSRQRGADTDCIIELRRAPGPRPRQGGQIWLASLNPECEDEGLRAFDLIGWQYDYGRVFLVARRGNAIGFSAAAARGEWFRDPAAGRPLWLKRM